MSADDQILILGGGQAAAQACASLRQFGYDGRIDVLAEEADLPYQRPPLSKAYMKGELDRERLYFKMQDWYQSNDIHLHLDNRAEKIDRATRTVRASTGEEFHYQTLIIATGSRPRPLPVPGAERENIFDLRSLADVDQIRPHMQPGQKIVIVGAGYIGLEAAAVAAQLGLDVTVIEVADRVLARVTSPVMSEFFEAEHKAHGVVIATGKKVVEFTGSTRVEAVKTSDGDLVPADLVLVGIGIIPNDELARQAGIRCDNGISVDRDGRTNDPSIFAIGDCARRPLVHYQRDGRLESVHNAIEQGKLAAAAIAEKPRPNEDCPWFWSDQYDLKLQIAGLSEGFDQVEVRGDPASRKFAVFYFKSGHLLAVDAVNSPAEFIVSKKLIISGASIAPEKLRDTTLSMKDIAAEAV